MRLFSVLFVLATTTTTILSNPPEPLTLLSPEQDVRLNNIVWLYSQFSLTFDGNELPLETHFFEHRIEFEMFKTVEDFFSDSNLKELFPNVDFVKLINLFEKRVLASQYEIMEQDNTPMTFKVFYTFFESYRNLDTSFVDNLVFLNSFCNVRFATDDDNKIIQDLEKFEIINPFDTVKKEDKDAKAFTLSDEYETELRVHAKELGLDPKNPKDWTKHHMISAKVLKDFYDKYFQLLNVKSEKIKVKKFNWIKIMEFNTQKSYLIQAEKFWNFKPEATLPLKQGRHLNFVSAQLRWPRGLLFMGPLANKRYDDPSSKKLDFEDNAKIIVGTPYFNKVKQLYNEIVDFNTNFQETDEYNTKAMKLRTKLETIYKEYNNGEPIWIFPCYSKHWMKLIPPNKKTPSKVWGINTNFEDYDSTIYFSKLGKWINVDSSSDVTYTEVLQYKEWREKELAQEQYNQLRESIGFVNVDGVLGSHYDHTRGGELKRRKRNHLSPTMYKCKMDVPTRPLIHEDSCSYYLNTGAPSILAVPYWGLCKLFG